MKLLLVIATLFVCAHAFEPMGILSTMRPISDEPPVGCCLGATGVTLNYTLTNAAGANSSSSFQNTLMQIDTEKQLAFMAASISDLTKNTHQDAFIWYDKAPGAETFTQTIYIVGQPACYYQPAQNMGNMMGPWCWDTKHGWNGDKYVLFGSTLMNVQATSIDENNSEYMALESATCLPHINVQMGQDSEGSGYVTQILYYNQFLKVMAPDAFNKPTGCKPLPPSLKATVESVHSSNPFHQRV